MASSAYTKPRYEVAGVKQNEDVGAHERVRTRIDSGLGRRAGLGEQRPDAAIIVDLDGGIVTVGERRNPLDDAVFEDAEIARLQSVDVPSFTVGDGEAQDHQINFGAKNGVLGFLRGQP
jgi:hypothetical protein